MKTAFAAAVFVLATALPAHATEVTQFAWDRTGESNLPCSGEVNWLLAPGDGIDNATVGINDDDGIPDGHAWTMLKNWETNEFYITSTEPVVASDEVLVAFVGSGTPSLTLVGCEGLESLPEPSSLPTTNPEPTPPTESSPTPTLTTWTLGFRVTTVRRTNVVARYRILCDGVLTRGRVRAMSPVSRTFSGIQATTCHITVRAWDPKPWNGPHGDGQTPKVTTWANHD